MGKDDNDNIDDNNDNTHFTQDDRTLYRENICIHNNTTKSLYFSQNNISHKLSKAHIVTRGLRPNKSRYLTTDCSTYSRDLDIVWN